MNALQYHRDQRVAVHRSQRTCSQQTIYVCLCYLGLPSQAALIRCKTASELNSTSSIPDIEDRTSFHFSFSHPGPTSYDLNQAQILVDQKSSILWYSVPAHELQTEVNDELSGKRKHFLISFLPRSTHLMLRIQEIRRASLLKIWFCNHPDRSWNGV